jgi:hypothetical protein
MKIRQHELYDANSHSRLMCWLPVDSRLKRGVIVTLKEIPRRDWIVMRVYKTEKDDGDLNRRWRVGGLR